MEILKECKTTRYFTVNIYNKKDNSLIASTIVESERDYCILLKGKMLLINQVRFDKRKHTISYYEN